MTNALLAKSPVQGFSPWFYGWGTNLDGSILQDPINFIDPYGRSTLTARVAGAIVYCSLITSSIVAAPVGLDADMVLAIGAVE